MTTFSLPRPSLRLNVASRLNLAFTVLGLAIVTIVVLGALSLERINQGVSQVVDGATPAQKAVADLQIELQEISRLALEHYNSVDPAALADFESEFRSMRDQFEHDAQALNQRLGSLEGLAASQDQLTAIVESSQALFDAVDTNMGVYSRSLQDQQNIDTIRDELQTMRADVAPLFDDFIADTEDPDARTLVFEIRNLVGQGFSLANELSLVGSIADFQTVQTRFRDFMDQYGSLGFRMMGYARDNEDFAAHQQEVGALVGGMIEQVSANDGLIPLKNNFLQVRASLRNGVTQTQAGLADEVQQLNAIADQVNQAATAIGQTAQDVVVQSRLYLIAMAVAALVFCALLSFLVVRSIRKPLKRLRDYMTQVGEGDFTVQFGQHTRDELGDISRATEQLVEALRQMISQVLEQNQRLNQVSLDTADIADDTRSHVERQRSELDSVATAINEMTASIREVASNAEVASKEMQESEQDARTIEGTVGTTMGAVQTLEQNMTNAVSVIKRLDEGVTSIEDILATIQGIAEQTNLLALNAAIEAARAGEQGRGFAVVADEVRTLAGRTQQSTEEIREKIEWMLKQSAEAVTVIETSQRSTHDVSEQTQVVQTRFTTFLEAISRLNELNTMIATASEQQSATTEEINQNIVAIREVSENTADGAQQASEQTHRMQDVASDLNQAVSRFKV